MSSPANPYDTARSKDYDLETDQPLTEDTGFGSEPASSAPAAQGVSVLGPTLVFKGELSAGEDLLIQGRVEGSIEHHERNLTIGEQGTVKANIKAKKIIIEGNVQGDMYGTESVIVKETAKVRGNIFSPRVGLKEGAWFKGGIDMDMKPDQYPSAKQSRSKKSLSGSQVDKLLDE